MSDKEWRPKVGERVRFEGVVTDIDNDNIPYRVQTDSGKVRWFQEGVLSPLPTPTPREPWEVLREAAALMQQANPKSFYGDLLSRADFLEAAARPKPLPTLAEAVRAFLDVHPELRIADSVIENMRDALARAEAEARQ